jgi:uncharacterized cupredoxin-like copper-binding protein
MKRSMQLCVATVAAVALVACTSQENPTATAGGTTDGVPVEGESVEVSLTEFQIDMPSSLSAGPVTFEVTNDGTTTHAFEVEGNGVEEETEELEPGASATLEVDLQAGTYEVYCPVDGHRDMGMEVELEVTGS